MFAIMLKRAIDGNVTSDPCPLDIWRAYLINQGMKLSEPLHVTYTPPPIPISMAASPQEVAHQMRALLSSNITTMAHIVHSVVFHLQSIVGSLRRPHEFLNSIMTTLLGRGSDRTCALLVKTLFQEVERRAHTDREPMSALLHVQCYTTAMRGCMEHSVTAQSLEDVLCLLGNMFAWERAELQPNEWTWTTAINAALKVSDNRTAMLLLGCWLVPSHGFTDAQGGFICDFIAAKAAFNTLSRSKHWDLAWYCICHGVHLIDRFVDGHQGYQAGREGVR